MKKAPITDAQIRKFVRENPSLGMQAVMAALHIGEQRLREVTAGVKKKPVKVEERVAVDRERESLKARARDAEEKYRHVSEEIGALEEENALLRGVKEHKYAPFIITPKRGSEHAEATSVICLSDTHCEETVTAASVGGVNEYNKAIAETRMRAFFRNSLRLVETQRHSIAIPKLVLWLGGDFITGQIHEEFVSNNWATPLEAIHIVGEWLAGGIEFLLKEGKFSEILVPCSIGNHGRTTHKMYAAGAYRYSYEYAMYLGLRDRFRNEPRVKFQLTESYFNYVEIYGKVIRFHHGDAIKFGGGQGGVTIPLNKFIWRSNTTRRADLDVIGHFHQYTPSSRFLANGSLIGYNAFAQRIGAEYEPPRQAYFQVDSKRGITLNAPIIVTE